MIPGIRHRNTHVHARVVDVGARVARSLLAPAASGDVGDHDGHDQGGDDGATHDA